MASLASDSRAMETSESRRSGTSPIRSVRKRSSASSGMREAGGLASSQFTLLNQIGTGSFGTVFRALHRPTNQQCAIKRIDLESSDDDIEEIQKEISILAECHDPHITRYFGCFMHEFELWIVMEFLGGGSCLDLVKELRPDTLSEPVIAEIIANVVEGLAYLHGSGKIHRDIKAANILLGDGGDVKIADFGVAAQLSNNLSRRNTFVGTPFWMAPEVINQLDYSFEADIWSLGITAIELAEGKPPLSHLHPMKALLAIPRNKPPRLGPKYSSDFQDFIEQCLQMDPKSRPLVSRLASHPFLTHRNRQELIRIQQATEPELEGPKNDGTLRTRTLDNTLDKTLGQTLDKTVGRTLGSKTLGSETINGASESRAGTDGRTQGRTQGTSKGSTEHTSPIRETVSSATASNPAESSDDDWDFGTVKPQPSLEQILQNPPAGQVRPVSPEKSRSVNPMDTLRDDAGNSLVRIFGHASRKFRDPVLDEITDLLRADPLTVGVENYLVRRIGRLAVQHFDVKAKGSGRDAVEQILLDKWLEEVQELHAKDQ